MIKIVTHQAEYVSAEKGFLNIVLQRLLKRIANKSVYKTAGENSASVSFSEETPFSESFFVLEKGGESQQIKVKDLFPDGEYIKEKVSSSLFVEQMKSSLSKAESVSSFVNLLLEDFESQNKRLQQEIQEWVDKQHPSQDDLHKLVTSIVPLNQSEQWIIDHIEQVSIRELQDKNVSMEKQEQDIIE